MTKRVLISIVLLLLAVSLSVGSSFLLRSRLSALGEALEDAVYTDLPASRSLTGIETSWENGTRLFHVFLLHGDVSQLQTEILSLPALTAQPEIYQQTCIRSLSLVCGMLDDVALTAENIL